MATTVTLEELNQLKTLVLQGRYITAYKYLYDKGYYYTGWAEGVAAGDTFAVITVTVYQMQLLHRS